MPRSADDAIVTDGAFDDLLRFLADGCDVMPGAILPRNACRGPWTHALDFHVGVDVPVGRNEVEVFLDVQNLVNAFGSANPADGRDPRGGRSRYGRTDIYSRRPEVPRCLST